MKAQLAFRAVSFKFSRTRLDVTRRRPSYPTMIATALIFAAALVAPKSDAPLVWDSAKWSRAVTRCDELTAHPSDPDKLTQGVSQAQLLAAGADVAIAACRAAVATDPDNPRLNYQLARTLGYAGRGNEAQNFRDKAVAGDYPQALFVVGFVHLMGQGAPKDVCKAAPLIRRSAIAGRFAGLVGYPHYVLTGAFAGCPSVRQNRDELIGFLARAQAHPENNDYFRGILIGQLKADVTVQAPAP